MLALAYSLALFLIWTLVGRAAFSLFAPRFPALRAWLLAPTIGLAIFLLGLMFFNQLGLPIAKFSRGMTAGFVVLGIAGLWRWRPIVPYRVLLPFFAAVLASLAWTGWPAYQSGFNWISYGNDDMANYCLAAERFATGGFYDAPTMAGFSGRDYASYYFFMHVADLMRFGAEHIVAWSATLAGLKATQAFMPAILALSLAQLTAASALALHSGRHRRRALVTAWILAASPLFMLGTLYQLIAQVGGIALLLGLLALLTHPSGTIRRKSLARFAGLPSIAAAGLCICYPEPTPFLALAYFLHMGLSVLRRHLSFTAVFSLMAYTMLGVVVLLRHNVLSYIATLVMQLGSATDVGNLLLSLFPYFLLPTGFSNFFGWMPIARQLSEPIVSITIAGGMLLAVILVVRAAREAWQLRAAALLLLVEALIAIYLYRGNADFPLYKLAMWMQPPLAAALAGLFLTLRWRIAVAALVVLFAASTAPTALYYSRSSLGLVSGGLTELRFGSRLGMTIPKPSDPNAQITGTIENVVAAKFAASALRGSQMALVSRDYFFPNTRINFTDPPPHARFHLHYGDMARALPLMLERNSSLVKISELWLTEFSQPILRRPTDYHLFLARRLSLFNKFGYDPFAPITSVFELKPSREVRNEIIFVHSGRGNHYYLGDRRFISFFQQEADPYNKGGDFNGIGRFMLLRVENPSEEIYLRIAATRTLLPGRTEWKTDGLVHHDGADVPLSAVGNGAFNLFIGPLKPRLFEGSHYVAIDFAEITQVILDRRTGLKAMYNRFVPLDYRRLLGWARDISALSPEQYRALRRPTRIANFPGDISRADTLEFSGMYEDGWISPDSKFVLAGTPKHGAVRLRGVVPELAGTPLGSGVLKLTLNGREFELPAAVGYFDWLIPAEAATDQTRLALHFTASTKLPGNDDRPTGAQLQSLEVLPALPGRVFDYGTAGAPRLAANGIDQDGWMKQGATIEIPATDTPVQIVLRCEMPGWGGIATNTLRLASPGAQGLEHALPHGETTLRLRFPASAKPRTLELSAEHLFPLPKPDTRQRACRILSLEIVPEA